MSAGRVDDAVRTLNARVQSNPADAEAYHLLSRAYFHLKKWDDAITYGERAVELNPNNAAYYMWLGRAYGEKADASSFITAAGLTKKIKSNFEKAVELDGRSVAARSDLAEFYIEAPGFMGGGVDKAAEQARQIAPLDPAKAHWVYARIAEKKKDGATAESEYKAAIQAGADSDHWLNLASFYRRQNRLEEMEQAVNKAIASPMKNSNSLYDAATLLYKASRNLPGAASYVQRYLSSGVVNEEAPTFEAHYLLGAILEKQGNTAAAAQEYRASLALAGEYKPAKEALRKING
ncbi:MAG: tetratricopeptide repeat protein [Terriglobales bacterium]